MQFKQRWAAAHRTTLIADGGAVVPGIGSAAAFVALGVDADGVHQSDMAPAFDFIAAFLSGETY